MQVTDSRAEDSSESGSSKEKELDNRSSGFTGSEGDAVKPNDGKGSDEDASVAHIPAKRHIVKKSGKKRVVGTADAVSSDDAELQNGSRSLKEASEDGRTKTEFELNSEKENAEDSAEERSGEERLVEASKRSQKVEELTKIAKPRGRPPKNMMNLQSEQTGEPKLPKIAKARGKPPKAKDNHCSDEDAESKVEEQEEIVEARSGSGEGDTGEADGLSHEKAANSGSVEDFPLLASPRRGRPPKTKTGSEEEAVKVARPRGRPPKPRDSQSGSEGEPAKSPSGRALKLKSGSTASSKRGRKPKVRPVESNTEEGGAVLHARPQGRPSKVAQQGGVLVSPKRGRLPKPKAKRGRPSKLSLVQSGITSPGGKSPKGKRKRGRPSFASLGVVSTVSPARARGRPMKQPRPRGRPPKVPLTSSGIKRNQPASPSSGQQLKVKGKRGRPSKVTAFDSGTEAPITKSPRGRPRKIKLTESGTGESSEMEDTEVTASSDRESSPAERENHSGSESGMKEEVEPELIAGPRRGRPPKAGKGIADQETGQNKSTKIKGRPPKRKLVGTTGRGRPPKVRVTESGIEGETEEEPTEPNNSVSPRRGRPPKVKPSDSSMDEDGDEPAISVSPRRGRPPKAKQPKASPDAYDSVQGATVGPKRGRPPKAKSIEISAEGEAWGEDQDQMCESPGTGSLRTEEENALASEPSEGEESEEKEGVTIEVTGAESISDSIEDEEEGKTKATGRGRPPKVKGFKSGSDQKKRGRPPKAKGPEEA